MHSTTQYCYTPVVYFIPTPPRAGYIRCQVTVVALQAGQQGDAGDGDECQGVQHLAEDQHLSYKWFSTCSVCYTGYTSGATHSTRTWWLCCQ